jgi:hypothetical protein
MQTTDAPLDIADYSRLPRLNGRNAIALSRSILIALPRDVPGSVKHAARNVRNDAVALQNARLVNRKAAVRNSPGRPLFEVDREADSLHGTVRRRLLDHAAREARQPEQAAQAQGLLDLLYPDKGAFTQGDMHTQWEETEAWFKLLAEGGHEATLKALVGASFVDDLRVVHAEYGEALGTTKAREASVAREDIAAPLAALQRSLLNLCLQLVAVANDGSAEPAVRKGARDALRPVGALREANARRSARNAADNDTRDADDHGTDDVIPDVA